MRLQPYTVCDGDLIHVTVMAISEEDAIDQVYTYALLNIPEDYEWYYEWLYIDEYEEEE
ncbi:Uncharacterised protein [Acinetobacter phage MD-2021a]|nr:Uncharacterised protein [Acinetobacter phage MD-2021a]CAH1088973.1 Uncharacterised protein [Acinetobacter phage MD-2021a]